jgi:hypothetical protein
MWFHIRIEEDFRIIQEEEEEEEEEEEGTGDLGTQNLLRRKRHQYLLIFFLIKCYSFE